MIDKTV